MADFAASFSHASGVSMSTGAAGSPISQQNLPVNGVSILPPGSLPYVAYSLGQIQYLPTGGRPTTGWVYPRPGKAAP